MDTNLLSEIVLEPFLNRPLRIVLMPSNAAIDTLRYSTVRETLTNFNAAKHFDSISMQYLSLERLEQSCIAEKVTMRWRA